MAAILVKLSRESGLDFYTVTLPNGYSEDVDAVDMLEWFRLRHFGHMDICLIERAIDDCWNFGSAEIIIENYRPIKPPTSRTAPLID